MHVHDRPKLTDKFLKSLRYSYAEEGGQDVPMLVDEIIELRAILNRATPFLRTTNCTPLIEDVQRILNRAK